MKARAFEDDRPGLSSCKANKKWHNSRALAERQAGAMHCGTQALQLPRTRQGSLGKRRTLTDAFQPTYGAKSSLAGEWDTHPPQTVRTGPEPMSLPLAVAYSFQIVLCVPSQSPVSHTVILTPSSLVC